MINSVVTNDGMSNAILAQNEEGFFIKIKGFGVSDVGGVLSPTRTTPNTEWYNGDIAYGKKINDNTIEVMCTIPPSAVAENKDVYEIYLYGEDQSSNTFMFLLAQPDPTALYTPTSELSFKLQITIQNLSVSSVYQFVYTQATEISEHNLENNAHPQLLEMLQKHGIFMNEIDRDWNGQIVDAFASDKLNASVADMDVVSWDSNNSEYVRAVADGTNLQNAVGIYIAERDTVVTSGIINYTHSLDPFTNVYLDTVVLGDISVDYSPILIGQVLPNNKLLLEIKNLIKYGAVVGGGGGAGSFIPTLGDVAPIESFTDGIEFLDFDHGLSQEIYFNFKIPAGYVAGNQLVLTGGVFYSQAIAGKVLFKAETALLKKGLHVLGTYSLAHTSTNNEVTVSSTLGEQNQIGNIDLTDSIGEIAGSVVEEGDILRIKVYRDVSNESVSATEDARLVKTCFEPKKVLV